MELTILSISMNHVQFRSKIWHLPFKCSRTLTWNMRFQLNLYFMIVLLELSFNGNLSDWCLLAYQYYFAESILMKAEQPLYHRKSLILRLGFYKNSLNQSKAIGLTLYCQQLSLNYNSMEKIIRLVPCRDSLLRLFVMISNNLIETTGRTTQDKIWKSKFILDSIIIYLVHL